MTKAPRANGIGQLNERALHAALCEWCAGPGDAREVDVDGYRIDVVSGELLVEVQTGNFSALRTKLTRLLEAHPVRVVYPIAEAKWIVRLPSDDDAGVPKRRKSPKRGRPIGLFDELALLVLERAAHAGLRVPHDLSVVGSDNVPAAAYAPPGLTTFDACTRRSAKEIGEMLVSLVEDRGGEPLRRLVRPEPVLRGSHGPAPRSERAVRRGRSKP